MKQDTLIAALAMVRHEHAPEGPNRAYSDYLNTLRQFVEAQGGNAETMETIAAYHLACIAMVAAPETHQCQALDAIEETAGQVFGAVRQALESRPAPTIH